MFKAWKTKKLDKLLLTAFQDLGEQIEPPSSQKLWQELQQRPEFAGLAEINEKFAGMQAAQKPADKGCAYFWGKYRNLAGLVAACFVLVIIWTRFAPLPGRGGNFFNGLLFPAQSTKEDSAEISMRSGELAGGVPDAPGEEEKPALKTFSLETEDTGESEPLLPRAGLKMALENPPANETGAEPTEPGAPEQQLMAAYHVEESGEPQQAQEQPPYHDLQASLALPEQDAQELKFTEEAAFAVALAEAEPLAPEGIWHPKKVSAAELQFTGGTVIKTEEALLSVRQVYKNQEGHEFFLLQQFLPDKDTSGRLIATADRANSLNQPIQVGPYNGYLQRRQPGFHTLAWLQEQSLVTLSGELGEEELYNILASLEDSDAGEN